MPLSDNHSFTESNSAVTVKHLSQAQLARRWNVSGRTLERWRWLRRGPSFLRLGGRIAYRIEDVLAFEAQGLRVIDPPSSARRSPAFHR